LACTTHRTAARAVGRTLESDRAGGVLPVPGRGRRPGLHRVRRGLQGRRLRPQHEPGMPGPRRLRGLQRRRRGLPDVQFRLRPAGRRGLASGPPPTGLRGRESAQVRPRRHGHQERPEVSAERLSAQENSLADPDGPAHIGKARRPDVAAPGIGGPRSGLRPATEAGEPTGRPRQREGRQFIEMDGIRTSVYDRPTEAPVASGSPRPHRPASRCRMPCRTSHRRRWRLIVLVCDG
jgi:hypothetical protein